MQNNITSLAIISGNILRDMYFAEEFRFSVCRQYKTDLETWMAKLPNSLDNMLIQVWFLTCLETRLKLLLDFKTTMISCPYADPL